MPEPNHDESPPCGPRQVGSGDDSAELPSVTGTVPRQFRKWFEAVTQTAAGVVQGAVAVLHDLTGWKPAESQRIERRVTALLELAPDAMVVVNAHGAIVMVNGQVEELYGYSRDELLGQPVETLIPHRFRRAHEQQRSVYNVKPWVRRMGSGLDLFGLHKDGRELPVEVSLSPLQTAREQLVVCAVRDVSERLRAEMEAERNRRELAHATRVAALGEMAAGLAHEVNQPLAAIAAYARGAAVRLKEGELDARELATVVDRIAADAHRAGEVIRRMRQFVRKRETERLPIDVNQLVGEVCRFLASETAQRKITIDLELADALASVRADSVEIQQVLINLVRNAFDAVAAADDPRRRIAIVTSMADHGDVEVRVDDCGPGISSGLSQQVFEPFFTSKDDGLGMGLAICRTLIEAHGGRIWAGRSNQGGASVGFCLPPLAEEPTHAG